MLMYISALPAALGFFLMWHAPAGLSSGALLAFMIAMLVLVNISISLYEVPSLALAPELAPDYTLRTKLLAYRWFFLMVGATATSVILYQVFLRQDESNPLGVLNRARYEQFGLACAFVIFAAILISTAATHSRIKYLYVPPRRRIKLDTELAQLKTALTHKPLLMLMFGGLMMGFGAGTTAGLVTYFNLHFWGLLPQQIAYLVAIAPVASLMALWLGPRLADRFGKKRAIIGLYVLWLLTATVPISLRLMGAMPEDGSALLLPILVANITMAYTLAVSCHNILGSAIADTVDDIAVHALQPHA